MSKCVSHDYDHLMHKVGPYEYIRRAMGFVQTAENTRVNGVHPDFSGFITYNIL